MPKLRHLKPPCVSSDLVLARNAYKASCYPTIAQIVDPADHLKFRGLSSWLPPAGTAAIDYGVHRNYALVVDPADEARWQQLKDEYAAKTEAIRMLTEMYGEPATPITLEEKFKAIQDWIGADSSKIIPIQQSACPPHEWVDIGFHFTRLVCKHCNQEKGT